MFCKIHKIEDSIFFYMLEYLILKMGGFPGGAVVESLPAGAGDTGSSPGLGRSHRPQSNWAREPQLLSLRVWSLCSTTREAAIVRGLCTAMKSGPRLPQLERALAQKRRPNITINQSINKPLKKKWVLPVCCRFPRLGSQFLQIENGIIIVSTLRRVVLGIK